MFYNVVVDEWGGTTYVPTTLGNVLLSAVIIALLAAAVACAGRHAQMLTQAQDPGVRGGGGGSLAG